MGIRDLEQDDSLVGAEILLLFFSLETLSFYGVFESCNDLLVNMCRVLCALHLSAFLMIL